MGRRPARVCCLIHRLFNRIAKGCRRGGKSRARPSLEGMSPIPGISQPEACHADRPLSNCSSRPVVGRTPDRSPGRRLYLARVSRPRRTGPSNILNPAARQKRSAQKSAPVRPTQGIRISTGLRGETMSSRHTIAARGPTAKRRALAVTLLMLAIAVFLSGKPAAPRQRPRCCRCP